jgi:hypothetical protein
MPIGARKATSRKVSGVRLKEQMTTGASDCQNAPGSALNGFLT